MLGESVPINFFYFVSFHVPFYMYVFLTKQLSMTMDGIAGNFTNRFISPSIHRRSYDSVLACLSGKRISPLPEGTANFSAMSYRDKKGERAIVSVSLRVGCFWAIIKEWKIDVCKRGSVIE